MCKCKCVWWMVLEWNVFEDVVCSRISGQPHVPVT